MKKRNIGQYMRSETLARIKGWIDKAKEENPEAEIDREALIKKICLVIGARKQKAEEYLEILGL